MTLKHTPQLSRPMQQQDGSAVFFCISGEALLHASDSTLTLHAGDLGVAPVGATIVATDDAVVLPFTVARLSGATRVIALGIHWAPFLVNSFVESCLGRPGAGSEELRAILQGRVWAPRMPTPAPALNVANHIISDPASEMTLNEFAASQHVASRTLQRQFESSTDLSFSEWRAAYRVYVAAGLLMRGATLDQAALAVGFGATSSLSRAFIRHTGTTPGKATKRRRQAEPPTLQGKAIGALSDADTAFWVYRGSATVTAGDYCRFAAAGETVTLLAGTEMQLEVAAESVVIPVPAGRGEEIATIGDALTRMAELFPM